MDLGTILAISIICGVCMYIVLILNMKVSKDVDEYLNTATNKLSVLVSIIVFVVLFCAEQVFDSNNQGLTDGQLLTKWE